jgi:hypothetical protein
MKIEKTPLTQIRLDLVFSIYLIFLSFIIIKELLGLSGSIYKGARGLSGKEDGSDL